MGGLNRRDFLKALGLGSGASALSACGVVDNNMYLTPIEAVLPYVVRPEQITPGMSTFFATAVLRGPDARPVLARHRDGRVVNVGANQRAPFAPAVPGSNLFELQKHYSPDRLRGPGPKGAAATNWDDALSALAKAVQSARGAGKKVVYLGPLQSGPIAQLIGDFTGGEAIYWEASAPSADAEAAAQIFGEAVLPAYDLSDAGYVLSFGAAFLGGYGGLDLGASYAKGRDPNHGNKVARYALVSPHRDQTGANCDDWHACVPGSEALVALAVAKLVAEARRYAGPLQGFVAGGDVAAASAASGLAEETIQEIADHFAKGVGVALPGGVCGNVGLSVATFALNIVAGNGGVRFGPGGYAGAVHGVAAIESLIEDLKGGRVGVLMIDEVNPVYALPALGFDVAMAKADLVVSLSSHPDETSAGAGLYLPISDTFEDWGSDEPMRGFHVLRQPAMTPLNDTRSLGDILLVTARAVGLQVASSTPAAPAEDGSEPVEALAVLGFGPKTWREYVQAWWQQNVIVDASDFRSAWQAALGDGFYALPSFVGAKAPVTVGSVATKVAAAAAQGEGDLFLHVYPHPHRQDGRYANQPWAQEVPDPMTGVVWDSWLEVHPAKAAELGVANNDLVAVKTAAGEVEVAVQVYPGVRKDTVALALGNGHTANGRYATGIGVNAAGLVSASGWTTKASVRSFGRKGDLVTAFSEYVQDDQDRNFAVRVNADAIAEKGDAETHHPGELTSIHEAPWDGRLEEKGITDFYGLPDHPVYRWGLTVDTNACNGCGACSVACYAENNLPVVGKEKVREGREMGWIRINRYWDTRNGADHIQFVPMMCQQCGHAGCESVCPVLATYHTLEGLNAMVYNRCAGTRYCSNACPFSARRFNYHSYAWPEPFNLQLNPEVVVRTMGVMEKCTFCVQRIRQVKDAYRDQSFTTPVPDEALRQLPACAEACPTQALTFGNLNDEASVPSKTRHSARNYYPLHELNVFPAVNYLAKASFHVEVPHHGGGHGGGHGEAAHDEGHDEHEAKPASHDAGAH